MSQVKIELLSSTPNALELIYAAFRQCYHKGFVGDMWEKLLAGELSKEKQASFVSNILNSGHLSPIEHVSFSFAISGVSRSLTHQLVRHRIASFSQQSQRYVDASNFEYVIPPKIANNPETLAIFESCMQNIAQTYQQLQELLKSSSKESTNEDARFVLPNAATTNIVMTMNCRSLLHFFEERCCTRAQWEIRHIANEMLVICQSKLPEIFEQAGAKCERLGFCPEGEKFCCGRYPIYKN